MARSTGYTAPNPPGTRSATTEPRVTMPCRSSRAWATACRRRVESGSRSGNSDHRPVTVGGPVLVGISGRPYLDRREPIRPARPPRGSPAVDGGNPAPPKPGSAPRGDGALAPFEPD